MIVGGVEDEWRTSGGRVEDEWRTSGGRVEDEWIYWNVLDVFRVFTLPCNEKANRDFDKFRSLKTLIIKVQLF